MTTRRADRRTLLVLIAAVGLSASVAGCSSSSSAPSTGSTPTATATATPSATASSTASAPAAGTSVTVNEKEFSLTLSQSSFAPGKYTFVATNVGTVTHALAIQGPGVASTQTSPINPGSKANLTVTLQAGSYELWCPIDDHKALGMDTHITVSAASTGAGSGGMAINQ